MRLRAEFTVEPFIEGTLGPHVVQAIDAARRNGVELEVGPFGTSVDGADDEVLAAVSDALRAALAHGATRVSLQVTRGDG